MARIDALVAAGEYESRAAFIVEAIDKLSAQLERDATDRAIVEGYTRIPPTPDELAWADAAGRRSIAEEPW